MPTYAILGAAGKVGFATSSTLRKAGVSVRAILRDEAKAERLRSIGCKIATADLNNVDSLAQAIAGADAVQVIVPPNPGAEDPAKDMRNKFENITSALRQTRPRQILLVSDYGSHVKHDIGMPSLFRDFEEQLTQLPGQKIIIRTAEHMENWARLVPPAISSGSLPTFHDQVDNTFPTISAPDLGVIAAQVLLEPIDGEVKIVHAEGPHRYSDSDVAKVLSEILGRSIHARPMPRSQWDEFLGFMPVSMAQLLIKSNEAQNEGGLVDVEPGAKDVRYGGTELKAALGAIVSK